MWALGLAMYVCAMVMAALGLPGWVLVTGIAVGFAVNGSYHFGFHHGYFGSWAEGWDEDREHEQADTLGIDWDKEWARWDSKNRGEGR